MPHPDAPTTEFSAGLLILRKTDQGFEWLLLQKPNGRWEFPKGKVEIGEAPLDAAIREAREEVGLSDLHVIEGFMHPVRYTYRDRWRRPPEVVTVDKTVVFYLAETHETTVRLSREHRSARWMATDEVWRALGYDNLRDLFRQALHYLQRIQ
ncbi:MAG: NUDIX domain-containing protein, partial [Acidobacteria bacterium]|nr:NUDIX domain-containing protein [Acidobacteriota bacterium]MDW7985093.1 NUDIX domain-containing protein [Acidobacteriota bacterium]